jgi:hypothetical protein
MRQTLAEHIVRSLVRGMAYRVAWASPVWLAATVLVVLFIVSVVWRI